jgi:tetratricopeptide (TPR) repeat protein
MIARHIRQLGQRGSAARRLALPWVAWLLLLALPARSEPGHLPMPQDQGESSSKRDEPPLPKDAPVKHDVEAENRAAADKDIEIGQFYMRKGDADAAIGRYHDAADVAPHLAKPRMLLAEAYEKKGDKASALKYYKEYLQVDPAAPDKPRILKKIDKLSAER